MRLTDGIKVRVEPQSNYKAVFLGGKTIRFSNGLDIKELEYPEFYDISLGTKCLGGCSWCLTPGQSITMGSGELKDIADVKVGDQVTVKGPEGLITSCVDQVHIKTNVEDVFVISAGGKTIRITGNHKILSVRGWIRAEDLLDTDQLIMSKEEQRSAASERMSKNNPMHNPVSVKKMKETVANRPSTNNPRGASNSRGGGVIELGRKQ